LRHVERHRKLKITIFVSVAIVGLFLFQSAVVTAGTFTTEFPSSIGSINNSNSLSASSLAQSVSSGSTGERSQVIHVPVLIDTGKLLPVPPRNLGVWGEMRFYVGVTSTHALTILSWISKGAMSLLSTLGGLFIHKHSSNSSSNRSFAPLSEGTGSITFNINNLCCNIFWRVTLDGMMERSNGGTITFSNVPAGTYYYTVASESSGYLVTPSDGNVLVNASTNSNVGIQFSKMESVTFNANNLCCNIYWRVTMDGMMLRSNDGQIVFSSVPPGNYSYTIASETSGYVFAPSSGTVAVNATNAPVVTTDFSSIGTVNFNINNLCCNNYWRVTLDGMMKRSNGGSITFTNVPPGKYYYTAASEANGYLVKPSSGYVNVNGTSGALVTLDYTAMGKVYFNLANLCCNNYWRVTLDGMMERSNGGQIVFSNVPNGTYFYTAASEASGYIISSSSGYVNVNGTASTSVSLQYNKLGSVTFNLAGLCCNIFWRVTLDGMMQRTNGGSITFVNVPSGKYYYTAASETNGYLISPQSGYVTVNGTGNPAVALQFTSLASVSFSLNGLCCNNYWRVTLDGMMQRTNGGSITFSNVPPGTYYYTASSEASGWEISPSSGYVMVDNTTSPPSVSLQYIKLASVTFNINNLCCNNYWLVTLDGMMQQSNGGSITFSNVPSGTYYYSAASEASGYNITSPSGYVTVNGTASVPVTISTDATGCVFNCGSLNGQSNVFFNEVGLPAGTTWGISIDGQYQTTTANHLNYSKVVSGKYSFVVFTTHAYAGFITSSGSTAYTPSPGSGSLTVGGSGDTNATITFSGLPQVTFSATGHTDPVGWDVSFADQWYDVGEASSITLINVPANSSLNYVIESDNPFQSFMGGTTNATVSEAPIGTVSSTDTGLKSVNVPFVSLPTLTIGETGISGYNWEVSVDGFWYDLPSTQTSILIRNVPANATLSYDVLTGYSYPSLGFLEGSTSAYFFSPANGSLTSQATGNVNLAIAFKALPTETFSSPSLASTGWSVSFEGTWYDAQSNSSIAIYNLPINVTLNYVIESDFAFQQFYTGSTDPSIATPSYGAVSIFQSNVTTPISSYQLPTITFKESGLVGANWEVDIGGFWYDVSPSVQSLTINTVPSNSTVSYVILTGYAYAGFGFLNGATEAYYASPYVGGESFQSTGNENQAIAFVPLPTLTINSSGTNNPAGWSVSYNGLWYDAGSASSIVIPNVPLNSSLPYVIESDYAYQIFDQGTSDASVASSTFGMASLTNLNSTLTLKFAPLPSVSFVESNFNSTGWGVDFAGTWYDVGNSTSLTIYNVPESSTLTYVVESDFTYAGFLTGPSGGFQSSPSSGTVQTALTGTETVSILFRSLPEVEFSEVGLPSSSTWSVSFDGIIQSGSGNGTILSYPNSPPNTVFPFSVTGPTGYFEIPPYGNVTVGIYNVERLIYFTNSSAVTSVNGNSTLIVHVVNNQGASLPGVYLGYYDQNQNPIGAAATGTDGYSQPVNLPSAIYIQAFPENLPYQESSIIPFALNSGNNTVTITLASLPSGILNGNVTNTNGAPIPDAIVTISQNYNGNNFQFSSTTNSSGMYTMSLIAGQATVAASTSNSSYTGTPQSVTIPVNGTVSLNTTLSELGPGFVNILLYTKYLNQTSFEGPLPIDWRVAVHFSINVIDAEGNNYFAETNPVPITGTPGEQVQACVNGGEAFLPSVCQSGILNSARNATISVYLAQQGLMEGNVVSSNQPVQNWSGSAFSINSTGYAQFVQSLSNSSSSLFFSPPSPGYYEINVQAQGPNGQMLYGSTAATVQAAQIVQVGNISLSPGTYFTGLSGNSLSGSPTQTTPGGTVNLRATYKNDGNASLSNAVLLIDVPAYTNLVSNSIALNFAEVNNSYSVANYVYVPLGTIGAGASGVLTYQLQLSDSYAATSLDPSLLVNYTSSGLEHQEAVGTATIEVSQVTIYSPPSIGSLQTFVDGQAPPQSNLTIYDNDTIIGLLQVPTGGYFTDNVTVPGGANSSLNWIRAQADTPTGDLNSAPTIVVYNPANPELIVFCMQQISNPTGRLVCVNPQQGTAQFPYVMVPGFAMTFSLTFTNASEVSDVQVQVAGIDLNATLGLNGVFTASFTPEYTLGTISVTYVQLLPTAGNGTIPAPEQLTPLSQAPPNSNQVNINLNQTNTAFNSTVTLPNGTSIYSISGSYIPNMNYTLTPADVSFAQLSGMPIYNYSLTMTNDSGILGDQFEYYVPYYALPANVVSTIDQPTPPQIPCSSNGCQVTGGAIVIGAEKFTQSTLQQLAQLAQSDPQAFQQFLAANPSFIPILEKAGGMSEFISSNGGNIITAVQQVSQLPSMFSINDQLNQLGDCIAANPNLSQEQADAYLQIIHADQTILPLEWARDSFYGLATAPLNLFQGGAAGYAKDWLFNQFGNLGYDEVQNDIKTIGAAVGCPKVQPVKPTVVIDPSGTVYSGLSSNPLSNVTVSIFQQNPITGAWSLWNAAPFGQQNPISTGNNGEYAWEVPAGNYSVTYQKMGYESAQSNIIPIPPPATGINVNLYSLAPPKVSGVTLLANGTSSYGEFGFNEYVQANLVNSSSVTFTGTDGQAISGTLSPINALTDSQGALLTRAAKFTPSTPFAGDTNYTVEVESAVKSYANVSMKASFDSSFEAQSSLTYSINTNHPAGLAVGEPVAALSETNQALATKVSYTWINPSGTAVSSESSPASASGVSLSRAFVPDQAGVWTLQSDFTDGNNVFQSSLTNISVVNPLVFTLKSLNETLNSNGAFSEGIGSDQPIGLGVTNSSPSAAVNLVTFEYTSLPPVSDLGVQTGAYPEIYADVWLNNTNIGGSASVYLTANTINSTSSVYYYSLTSGTWVKANSTITGTNTVMGVIPVSDLSGTPVAAAQSLPSSQSTTMFSFYEKGLPSGTMWNVTLNGKTLSSTTNEITYSNLSPGNYSWSTASSIKIGNGTQFTASPASGTVSVPSQTNTTIAFSSSHSQPHGSNDELLLIFVIVAVIIAAGAGLFLIRRRQPRVPTS
jgi:hypothetical protein